MNTELKKVADIKISRIVKLKTNYEDLQKVNLVIGCIGDR